MVLTWGKQRNVSISGASLGAFLAFIYSNFVWTGFSDLHLYREMEHSIVTRKHRVDKVEQLSVASSAVCNLQDYVSIRTR